MSIQCCGGPVSFLAPSLPCVRTPCDSRNICSDLLNASVQSIIMEANPRGLTADEILNEIMLICGDGTVLESDLNIALNVGARRGVLKRTIRNGLPAFMVNGAMSLVNPKNQPYTRCLCEFYRERGVGRNPQSGPNCVTCAIPISTDGIQDVRPVPQSGSCCTNGNIFN